MNSLDRVTTRRLLGDALAGIRELLGRELVGLSQDLHEFPQSPHTSQCNPTLASVCEALHLAHQNPSAYTISELRQRIAGFVKRRSDVA